MTRPEPPERAWPALVIFDCDGVLVDSEVIALGCAREAIARLGVALDFEQTRDLFVGIDTATMRNVSREKLGLELPGGFEAELARDTIAAFERDLRPIAGLSEALPALGAPVCVASSSSPQRIAASLALVGFTDLFGDRVFSGAEAPRGKPAPDLFLIAAARLGAPSQACLVIEDSAPGIEAALGAGMTAFGFAGAGHAQGEAYRERLRAAGASRVFDDMAGLPALVDEERRARRGQGDG